MPARVVDLRSDTVTHPTPAMREAMACAEVGDDGHGEDPTVQRLEALAAERLGKEAAVLVSSGTMGNLVGALTQTEPGDTMIVGAYCHPSLKAAAGIAVYGGVKPYEVPTERGRMDPADVRAAIRTVREADGGRPTLLCLENTHNQQNGSPLDPEAVGSASAVAHVYGLRVHVDGARLFNAAVALDVPASDLVADVDSVSFCLSKGLSCPVGSLLCGDTDFVERARGVRKLVGGTMRQSGVIAAAGIVALDRMIDRLAEDHANARRLAEGLAALPGLSINPSDVPTNLVFADLDPARFSGDEFSARLAAEGVLVGASQRPRFVTHYGITAADVDFALAAIGRVTAGARTSVAA